MVSASFRAGITTATVGEAMGPWSRSGDEDPPSAVDILTILTNYAPEYIPTHLRPKG